MVRHKQSHFFKSLQLEARTRVVHGGEIARGKRKMRRPLDTRKPLHLVMRSSKAKGSLCLLSSNHKINVEKIVKKQASKFGVRIASFANVGNHLHLLLRFSHRIHFQMFLKSVTAMIARAVTRARRGKPFGKFWDALAFSRVLLSSKEFAICSKYVEANRLEASFGRDKRAMFLASRATWEHKLYSG